MAGLIIDARKIKAMERLQELIDYTGQTEEFRETVWLGLIEDEDLMYEFMYYLDHHEYLDQYKFQGYGLSDLYFWSLNQYNLKRDLGKNPRECDKEAIVLESFYHMIGMKKEPEKYFRWLNSRNGMDMF